jgi:hypothetical protein
VEKDTGDANLTDKELVKYKKKVASLSPSSSSSSSLSSLSSSESDNEEVKRKGLGLQYEVQTDKSVFPAIKAINGQRIRVCTSSGQIYEADRYCPHKHVDMAVKVSNQYSCNILIIN